MKSATPPTTTLKKAGSTKVTDEDILALKRAYTLFQSAEILFEYGPLRMYADYTTIQGLWHNTIDPAVTIVNSTERKVAEKTYLVDAPSPWHAYFYLRAQQQYVYRAGRPLGTLTGQEPAAGAEHLFFRGQRCATWEFRSSLRRQDAPAQAIEQRAVAALREYFRLMFAKNADIADNTARCFAQHYGIATDLADISCDPDMAVWFATHPVGKPCPSGEGLAAVRAVTWAGQQARAETVFLLPPPFVRNVYQQRGLFIDASITSGALVGNLILDVSFLRETAGGEFQVIREGSPVDVWPSPDDSERELVDWARRIGTVCVNGESVRAMVSQERDQDTFPEFWLEHELYDIDKHVVPWISILDWVLPATCVTAIPLAPSASGPLRYEILEAKARALVRANPSFFDAFLHAVSEGTDFTNFEALRLLLTIARDELGS